MEMSFGSRIKHAWNIFRKGEDAVPYQASLGDSFYYRPDRTRLRRGNERSIVTAIYNRIAMDVAATNFQHVQLDDNKRFSEEIYSGLNECLTLSANLDQTGRAFIQDAALSLLDEGCVALVPTDTDDNPATGMVGSYDIDEIRVARITQWYPRMVTVSLYNENTGRKQDLTIPKETVAIVENPFYSIMNEPNSTAQRLIRKLNLLDAIDEQSGAGKLDIIIQLPYIVKTETRRQQAEARRKEIERQLAGSKYGIAYIDGTEHVTQLNRPAENNLMSQIEYLTKMLYGQLGVTQEIMDGTASPEVMLNYYTRTIEPICSALVDEMKRKFLTKTARTRGQSIMFYRDPFKLVPAKELPELADKMTRNEIMTSNEVRQIIGLKPSSDPKADQLVNANLNQAKTEATPALGAIEDDAELSDDDIDSALNDLDVFDDQLNELEGMLDEELVHYASPYYDPEKAHQYYEEHKKLKGRTSTAGLNDAGKEAARYVKEQLTTERKTKVNENKEETKSKIESLNNIKKSTLESHKAQMQSKISSLREMLSGMSKANKKKYREQIQSQIDQLRSENKELREQLQAQFSAERKSLNEGHKQERARLKTEYDEKYASELEKIKADPSFQSTGKRKK